MMHDCIYQFLRIFYHSRFKPRQLELTPTQLSAPIFDLVLVHVMTLRCISHARYYDATSRVTYLSHIPVGKDCVQV